MYSDTAPCMLCAVCWPNALLSCSNGTSSRRLLSYSHLPVTQVLSLRGFREFAFLESVDEEMEVEDDVCAITEEDPLFRIQTLSLQIFQFLEETGDVDNAAAADEVEAAGINKSGWENMKIVCLTVGYYGTGRRIIIEKMDR